MKYEFDPNKWPDFETAEETCFLLTNGLGGFCSLSVIGSNARGDHALLMGADPAPTRRYHMLTNVHETLKAGEETWYLASQRFASPEKNIEGFRFLESFCYEYVPTWTYRAGDITIRKTISMVHGFNGVILYYSVCNAGEDEALMEAVPLIRRTDKNTPYAPGMEKESDVPRLTVLTDGLYEEVPVTCSDPLYFSKDAPDGRDAEGLCYTDHRITFRIPKGQHAFYIAYGMEEWTGPEKWDAAYASSMIRKEEERLRRLQNGANLTLPVAGQLVTAADAYIVDRASTGEKSIIAGYPFFADWGRDTMIALYGCTLATGRYEDAKSILRSFMAYERRGLLPNLFPEGGQEPVYNTADASLLFINAIYQYYTKTKDRAFVMEAWPVMQSIISWYQRGTDYNIHMDKDGLMIAGEGLWQVTWMDVRFGEILPTPRHGKPVEINAYWYNALKIMDHFNRILMDKNDMAIRFLAEKVRRSFNTKFWNEEKQCLRDVISGTPADDQVRCNQIWALSMPFTMLGPVKARRVLDVVLRELYTPLGLRSLTPEDKDFHPVYGGSHFERDMAYHQGTVWAYPAGAFYKAWIRFSADQRQAAAQVMKWLEALEPALSEGCLGHIAEIYDGLAPSASRGCFAQAWSVGEILAAFEYAQEMQAYDPPAVP